MTLLVHLTALAIIGTKLCDCITTQRHMTGLGWEANPLARRLMKVLGPKSAIWFVFFVTVLIVGITWAAALKAIGPDASGARGIGIPLGFILIGALVSVVQGAVAYMNATHTYRKAHTFRPMYSGRLLSRLLLRSH